MLEINFKTKTYENKPKQIVKTDETPLRSSLGETGLKIEFAIFQISLPFARA
jgi:hypothetical protein